MQPKSKLIMNPNIQLIITDLDGTLLNDKQQVSPADMQTLHLLGKQNILRVAATGRSFYSARQVLNPSFPIDYVIFSTGAGVVEWPSQRLIFEQHLHKQQIADITNILLRNPVDFMILDSVPENHYFWYYTTGAHNPDFYSRMKIYKPFGRPFRPGTDVIERACQFLAIIPPDLTLFHRIKAQFSNLKIIRTTSPLDKKSVWLEIFPAHVSKGTTAEWLSRQLHINRRHTLGIGNDFNDEDFLEWVQHGFIVDNAAPELKQRFRTVASNENNGFSAAVQLLTCS